MFAVLIILCVLNFLILSYFLIRRSRETDFPLWLYALSVLLFWLPAAIYPILFYLERKKGRKDHGGSPLFAFKITSALFVFVVVFLTQPLMMLLLKSMTLESYAEISEACALFFSVILSVMLIRSVRFVERHIMR